MIGLAWVLSNKALMSTFNCLHGFPCQVTHAHMHRHARTHTHMHTVLENICPIWNSVQVIQNLYSSAEYKQTIMAVIPGHYWAMWLWRSLSPPFAPSHNALNQKINKVWLIVVLCYTKETGLHHCFHLKITAGQSNFIYYTSAELLVKVLSLLFNNWAVSQAQWKKESKSSGDNTQKSVKLLLISRFPHNHQNTGNGMSAGNRTSFFFLHLQLNVAGVVASHRQHRLPCGK